MAMLRHVTHAAIHNMFLNVTYHMLFVPVIFVSWQREKLDNASSIN